MLKITVVCNSERPASGLRFISGEELPEVLDTLAVLGTERQHLVHLVRIVCKNHVPMQARATLTKGPFIADQGSEPSRLVVSLGIGGYMLPHSPARSGDVGDALNGFP